VDTSIFAKDISVKGFLSYINKVYDSKENIA
jgi:hypothetical protein